MLSNTCYITYPELLYNIQVWLYNIQDGYITHPNLPDDDCSSCYECLARPAAACAGGHGHACLWLDSESTPGPAGGPGPGTQAV